MSTPPPRTPGGDRQQRQTAVAAGTPYQLTLPTILERARRFFPDREIVSAGSTDGRFTYGSYAARVASLRGALQALGVGPGDRVATFAWNHHRHLELYFAVPSVGAVLHTVNIRLPLPDVAYILDHAADTVLFVDATLVPSLREILAERPHLTVVIMEDAVSAPVGTRPSSGRYHDFEALVAAAPPPRSVPIGELDLAALCYTSGTTGRPKGVPYSHRTLVLHTFAACLSDGHAISGQDTVLHIVPMFHANAWGIPFAATMMGAKQVLPGAHPSVERIAELMVDEEVTYTGMVPTVAADLLDVARRRGLRFPALRALVLGGSAPSPVLVQQLEEVLGAPVYQGWGMTELAPMASFGPLVPVADGPPEINQGRLLPGLEWKLLDDKENEQPWDGTSPGELLVRGLWAAQQYYRAESASSFADGWLRTGDIAVIDPTGKVRIVDRKKELIKSGGEWISPSTLESALLGFNEVAEAAVIGARHPRWQERPIAVVVGRAGCQVVPEVLLDRLGGQFARWWLPDRIVVVDSLPRTGVGKIDKRSLRDRYGHLLEQP